MVQRRENLLEEREVDLLDMVHHGYKLYHLLSKLLQLRMLDILSQIQLTLMFSVLLLEMLELIVVDLLVLVVSFMVH